MQWSIDLLYSHNVQLGVTWILGAITTLIILRFIPAPQSATAPSAQPTPESAPKVDVAYERRNAVEIALLNYNGLQIKFDSVPREFWETVRDSQFPALSKIAPKNSPGNPSLGLWYIVQAFVAERFKYTSQIMGALCDNKAAMNELERLAERAKGFKAGQHT